MTIAIIPIRDIPMVQPGDDVAGLVGDAIATSLVGLKGGDVVTVCQKIVSKAEGAVVALDSVSPSPFAETLAAQGRGERDPRVLEVVLREAARIVRNDRGHVIAETRHGFVCANAGVDQSNGIADRVLTLLPTNPDRSAADLRDALERRFGTTIGVVITDTFGRAWREGLVDTAIGCAGLPPLLDHEGRTDLAGRPLQHTVVALADQVAAAAGLVMAKDAGVAAAIVRGIAWTPAATDTDGARSLVRIPEFDLFR